MKDIIPSVLVAVVLVFFVFTSAIIVNIIYDDFKKLKNK